MKIFFDSDLPAEGVDRLSAALENIAEGDDLSAELLLVSEEEIRELNARERGVDRVTDVLSFPSMDGIKGKPVLADEHRRGGAHLSGQHRHLRKARPRTGGGVRAFL